MNDRESIIRKVKRLRALTTKRGCSEAEAMAAAEKVAQLMAEYGLSDDDVEISEAASETAGSTRSQRAVLASFIGKVTNTAAIFDWRDGGYVVVFVGSGAGPEIAAYLRDICERAIDRELRQFKKSKFYRSRRSLATKRRAAADFTGGIIQRICVRLRELFADTMSNDAYSRAIAARDARYQGLPTKSRGIGTAKYSAAAAAGWDAGGNVGLHHGVGGGGAQKMIGGAG